MIEPILNGMVQSCDDRSEPLLRAGNTNCGGCGMSIGLMTLSRAIAKEHVQLVIPACCGILTPGPYPYSAYGAPVVASTFASAAAVATGMSHVARLNGEDTRVIAWAGDGGTYDIGMATISGAAERNEDVLFICYDNEIYGNTGGQRSGATPLGAVTTTTRAGKSVVKKDILGIMAAHGAPYVASVSLAHMDDAYRKLKTAIHMKGFRFIHMLAPCPTGWKSEPGETVLLIREAVESGIYPVIEIRDGYETTVNIEPSFSQEALEHYFASQGRFRKSPVSMDTVREAVDRNWRRLRLMSGMS